MMIQKYRSSYYNIINYLIYLTSVKHMEADADTVVNVIDIDSLALQVGRKCPLGPLIVNETVIGKRAWLLQTIEAKRCQ